MSFSILAWSTFDAAHPLIGAIPDRRWEAIRNGNNGTTNGNGNGKEPKKEEKKPISGKDVCKHCSSRNMKSVTFNANGRRMTRMKCQDCQKWEERISWVSAQQNLGER